MVFKMQSTSNLENTFGVFFSDNNLLQLQVFHTVATGFVFSGNLFFLFIQLYST